MTRTATHSIRNQDGSLNLERAMEAGHQARTEAIRTFVRLAGHKTMLGLRGLSRFGLRRARALEHTMGG